MTISDSIVEGVQSIVSLAHSCYGRKRCACFTYKNWYRTRTPLFALVFINIYDFIPCVTINFWNAHKWLVTETLSRSFKMRQFSTLAACSTSRRRKKLFNFPIYEFRFWKFGWSDFRSNANRQKNGINKAAAAKLNPRCVRVCRLRSNDKQNDIPFQLYFSYVVWNVYHIKCNKLLTSCLKIDELNHVFLATLFVVVSITMEIGSTKDRKIKREPIFSDAWAVLYSEFLLDKRWCC